MLAAATTLALRLLLCAAGGWLLWQRLGPGSVAVASPAMALLLRRPIIEFVAAIARKGHEDAVAGRQGRFYQHRGTAIDIADDDEGHRWLLTADVRKVVPALPRDEVLQRLFGDRTGPVEGERGFRIRADALQDHLGRATDPATAGFTRWLDADVVKPAARARG